MAATHSGGFLFPSATPVLAGVSVVAATPQTSAIGNNSAGYGMSLSVAVTNAGTGPTLPASVTVLVSFDGTNFMQWAVDQCGVAASGVYAFSYSFPPEISYAKVVVGGNTAQAVTATGQVHLLTGL